MANLLMDCQKNRETVQTSIYNVKNASKNISIHIIRNERLLVSTALRESIYIV